MNVPFVAILEDDPRRVAEMRPCLAALLPSAQIIVFDNAQEMIGWLDHHLHDVAMISLDHDLPFARGADGNLVDFGTGRQVVDFIVSHPPTCPVIVHSSNQYFAPGMVFVLSDAGWPHRRVYPRDDLEWVRTDWTDCIRQMIDEQWIAV